MSDFNVDFSKKTQYDDNSSSQSILWGAGGPVLETELNEMQYIQNKKLKMLLDVMYEKDGLLGLGSIQFLENTITIDNEYAIIAGNLIFIDHLELTPTEDGISYINAWEETVTIDTQSIYKYGNVQGQVIDNYILDTRYNKEITRRIVLNYNLVESKDLRDGYKLEICQTTTDPETSVKTITPLYEIVRTVNSEELENKMSLPKKTNILTLEEFVVSEEAETLKLKKGDTVTIDGVTYTLMNDDYTNVNNYETIGGEIPNNVILSEDYGNPEVAKEEFKGFPEREDLISEYENTIALLKEQNTFLKEHLYNPNVLDNPWFQVNQRGNTIVTEAEGFICDRWQMDSSVYNKNSLEYDNGIITINVNEGYVGIRQSLPTDLFKKGEKVTVSVMNELDEIFHATINWLDFAGGVIVGKYNIYSIETIPIVVRALESGVKVKAVKLEKGSISTLHIDTEPNYQQELAKCQRYYYRISSGADKVIGRAHFYNTTNAYATFNLPVPIRKVPQVSVKFSDSNIGVVNGDYASSLVKIIKIETSTSESMSLPNVTATIVVESEVTSEKEYDIFIRGGASIEFSAEL